MNRCAATSRRAIIFFQNRHPYLASRGHGQPVEPARMVIAEWCSVGGESASARIEAEQETGAESGHPDDPVRVAGNLHGRHIGPWWRKQADAACGRVEATNMFAAHFSEPDHALWIDGHTVGNERLHRPFRGEWIVPHETGTRIEAAQGIAVEFREPDSAARIECQLNRRAWKRERLARRAVVGNHQL